jgi:regulator of protease activity HflC (stomatin/prohibitin superfamily)
LKIDIQVILQWIYYAVSAYLVVSLAVNIALSMLKGNILSFDYTLFPKILLTKDKTGETTESETASWKISLKSLYTIRYTFKILPALALALVFVLFLSTSIFVVQPHQQAAVYHFGKLKPSSIKNAGLHFKFPWPIDKAEIYDVHRAASMQIGYESSGTANFLWTQKHDIGEYMLLLGNGNEMVAVNLKIMYVISDLYSYIKTCTNAEAVLSAAAYNALMSRTVNTTLDSFLSVDRNSLSVSLLNELSAFCKSEGLGFSVVQIIIESIHPPVDIADVYQKVVSASVDKTTAITRAHAYAEAKVIEAARQSKRALDQAKALQYNRTSDAQKETAVFYAAADAYRISPGSYELTKNLDVYEKIISGHKVYVFSRGAENSISKFIIGKVNTLNLLDANRGDGNE